MSSHSVHPPPETPAAGYTLVELMVAVALLALLLALSLPSWQNFVMRRQLDGLSARLQTDLHLLRSTTVARNQPLRLSFFSSTAGTCYLIHSGSAADCRCEIDATGSALPQCDAGTELLRSQVVADARWRLKANVASMAVDPRHGTFSPTGSIELVHSSGLSLRHVVNILGRTRLCTPAAALSGIAAC